MGGNAKGNNAFLAISKYLVLQCNKADWQAWELTHFFANTLLYTSA